MSNNKDIRWKQRATNFLKAFQLLHRSLTINDPSDIERAGMIQFFEVTFEMAWKLLKDYAVEEGYNPKSPRESIKLALRMNIIEKDNLWFQALEDRNTTVHTYDESYAQAIEQRIRNQYFPLLVELSEWIKIRL